MTQPTEKVIPVKDVRPDPAEPSTLCVQLLIVFTGLFIFAVMFVVIDNSRLTTWAKMLSLLMTMLLLIDARRSISALIYHHVR